MMLSRVARELLRDHGFLKLVSMLDEDLPALPTCLISELTTKDLNPEPKRASSTLNPKLWALRHFALSPNPLEETRTLFCRTFTQSQALGIDM